VIYLLISIFAILLYALNYKIPALLIFTFFITLGFDFVPQDIDEGFPISKCTDFATIILLGMVAIDSFCIKKYLKPDTFVWLMLVFFVFLGGCVLYNQMVLKVSIGESLLTIRYQFLWLAYFVFRNMKKEEVEALLKSLFVVTVICSVVYLLQIFFDVTILNKAEKNYITFLGMRFPRYYNQPPMLFFFTFMAIFKNPFRGLPRLITIIILSAAFLGAFHRNMLIAFVVAIAVGYLMNLPPVKRLKYTVYASIAGLFMVVFAGYTFTKSRTYSDIQTVLTGNFEYTDVTLFDIQGTMTYRIAHLLERNQYILENPQAMVFGGGLMKESSKLSSSLFGFELGLLEELTGTTSQIVTPDISYSMLLIRYGYLGTALNVMLFIYLAVQTFKRRERGYGLVTGLSIIVLLIISLFSWNLIFAITYLLPLAGYCTVIKEDE